MDCHKKQKGKPLGTIYSLNQDQSFDAFLNFSGNISVGSQCAAVGFLNLYTFCGDLKTVLIICGVCNNPLENGRPFLNSASPTSYCDSVLTLKSHRNDDGSQPLPLSGEITPILDGSSSRICLLAQNIAWLYLHVSGGKGTGDALNSS